MDSLTRQETLTILASMGVQLPPATRMSDDALQKRLKQALNCAQYASKVLGHPPLEPTSLPAWSRPAFEGVRRTNFLEIYQTSQGMEMELYTNPMLDARQTLMSIAKWWDKGYRWLLAQDHGRHCAISIRLLSVLQLDEDTPAIIVLYQSYTRATALKGVAWVRQMQENYACPGPAANINATPLEQKLLLKLLSINEKLLPSTYTPQRVSTEKNFHVSFLLPLGPLGYGDIAKLNNDPGCALCGRKTASRCAQCLSASYCGSDCQKADWPGHKHACRSLKGGTWRTLPFVTVLPGMEGMYVSGINKFSQAGDMRPGGLPDPNAIPPNIHGDRLFLVKVQIEAQKQDHFVMYDRQRSIMVYLVEGKNPELFVEMKTEMRGPRGGYRGAKMYRWAKRTNDSELRICVNKEPQTEIKW